MHIASNIKELAALAQSLRRSIHAYSNYDSQRLADEVVLRANELRNIVDDNPAAFAQLQTLLDNTTITSKNK